MFWVGGVLQCIHAVLHSIGQTFPNTASASGECLAPAVEGEEGLTGHPNGGQSFSQPLLTALVSRVSTDRGG